MGVGSIVLGVLALLMMFGGIVLTWLPGVGSVLSFGAPVVALAGAVLGGLAMSRSKQEGGTGGAGLAGLITSIVAFLLGLVFALTCGLCNALCTAGMVAGPRHRGDGGVSWSVGSGRPPPWLVRGDGGVGLLPPLPAAPPAPDAPPSPDAPPAAAPPAADGPTGGPPPPAFPPPPIAPPAPAPPSAPR